MEFIDRIVPVSCHLQAACFRVHPAFGVQLWYASFVYRKRLVDFGMYKSHVEYAELYSDLVGHDFLLLQVGGFES